MTDKTLIPDSLLAAKDIQAFEDWMLDWRPTTEASRRDEMAAMRALQIERFVRRNVSREKFCEWMQENPRTFTTRRELAWMAQKSWRPFWAMSAAP